MLLSYLAQPEYITLGEGERPPVIDLMRAHPSATMGGGVLPALQLAPPADVRFQVPTELPAAARLHVEMGVRNGQYRRSGSVRFRWSQGGTLLLDRELSSGGDTPATERRWYEAALELSAGEELRLEVSYSGDAARTPTVGIGELELREVRHIERTLASSEEPNVVLVVVDTLRADRLGAYGGADGTSPHLDAIARKGALFERAFATSPWTAPSTASILSAASPPEHGVRFGASVLSPSLTTIAEVLQSAGLTTAAFTCNNLVSKSRNFDQGFEHFVDRRWEESEDVVGEVTAWLQRHREHRFFLYVHFVDPHEPYDPAPRFAEAYASTAPTGYEDLEQSAIMMRLMQGEGFDESFLEAVAAHNLVLYDGEIASVDDALGLLDRALVELDLADKTVLCVTSDHGEEFMEHGLMGHVKQLHNESVHVPLIFRGPKIPAGVRVPHPVQNQLIGPTLLRLCDVAPPREWPDGDLFDRDDASGLAFFTTSRGRYYDDSRNAWSEACQIYGVRAGRWLLFSIPGNDAEQGHHELYDVEADPRAGVNLADEHPDHVRTLVEAIEAWKLRDALSNEQIRVEGREDREALRALGYVED